jgi:hypothetical protein
MTRLACGNFGQTRGPGSGFGPRGVCSEKLKNGPVTAHTTIIPSAKANTQARPASRDVTLASSANSFVDAR